jgi:hypothetical protein
MARWFAVSMGALLAAGVAPAHAVEGERVLAVPAAQREVRGEITPYLWIVGMDADVTVGGTPVSTSSSFSDLMDAADFGGSVAPGARRQEASQQGAAPAPRRRCPLRSPPTRARPAPAGPAYDPTVIAGSPWPWGQPPR